MNPPSLVPNLREKPPDPIFDPPIEAAGGRRSSSRLAISAKSRKGKDAQSGGKSHQGLVKLNLGDFIPAELHDRGKFEVGINPPSREEESEDDQNEIGLKFLDNGVVLATSQQMEEDSRDVSPTSVTGNSLIPTSNNECVMNTNVEVPLSPGSDTEIPEITMLPVDLNPRFDELNSPKGNPSRFLGENGNEVPVIPDQEKKRIEQVENVCTRNQNGRPTFAEQMKANNESEETRLEYFPPSVTPSGGKRVIISIEDLSFSAKAFSLHLYGYFLVAPVLSTANRFAALDSVMIDCPGGPHYNLSENHTKFYEFTEDTIENVLRFKPSNLSIPRVNDSNLDLGESLGQDVPSDEDMPDFDITNAQKKAISSKLEKYGAVKAEDQVDWSQGEWEYFHYLKNSMQIDPNTCVEDVDSDNNGTARFFKYQLEKDILGDQQKHAPSKPPSV
ncbi:hypothetical protein L1987_47754 [Smallanthus sonchifolius]|uniref:Uncharacterized protein n=1 Tax=Smallanthus sonchifolius TaxID=185202 RepID=A0ACB9FQY7_9ASTR|nr:hypothetical protein L1987_47754 [Smallanthus sonchifolius]